MSTGQKCFDRKLSNNIFHSYFENLCYTKEQETIMFYQTYL